MPYCNGLHYHPVEFCIGKHYWYCCDYGHYSENVFWNVFLFLSLDLLYFNLAPTVRFIMSLHKKSCQTLYRGVVTGGRKGRSDYSLPKNLRHKKGPPLNIFRFLIPKNFKHKNVRLESLKYFYIPNIIYIIKEAFNV